MDNTIYDLHSHSNLSNTVLEYENINHKNVLLSKITTSLGKHVCDILFSLFSKLILDWYSSYIKFQKRRMLSLITRITLMDKFAKNTIITYIHIYRCGYKLNALLTCTCNKITPCLNWGSLGLGLGDFLNTLYSVLERSENLIMINKD